MADDDDNQIKKLLRKVDALTVAVSALQGDVTGIGDEVVAMHADLSADIADLRSDVGTLIADSERNTTVVDIVRREASHQRDRFKRLRVTVDKHGQRIDALEERDAP